MIGHEKAKIFLNKAEAELNKCLDLVEENKEFSITEFDNQVRQFCEIVTSMPKEDAKFYEESLLNLSDTVRSLEKYLINRRDEVKTSLQSLGNQQKGQSAYKKGEVL